MPAEIKEIISNDDERLGHLKDGAAVKWPKVDVLGQPYNIVLTTVDLSRDHFVVLPAGQNSVALINQVKAAYKVAPPSPAMRRPKEDPGSGDQ